jgi:hypothetical protein
MSHGGYSIWAIHLDLASFQSMAHPTALLPVMDPDSPATRKTVCDVAQDEDAATQVFAWLRLGRSAADAPPLPPTGPLASSPPARAPSSTSPLAISNASQHARQQHSRGLDSVELVPPAQHHRCPARCSPNRMLALYRSAVAGLIAPLLQTISDSSRYGTSTGYEPRYYLLDQHSYNWSDIATQSDLQSVVSLIHSENVL